MYRLRVDYSAWRAYLGFLRGALTVETALANSTGTHCILEVARKNDARLFYASSSEMYWDPDVFPRPGSYEGRVDPLGHRLCYGEGERFAEALCWAYLDESGLVTGSGV